MKEITLRILFLVRSQASLTVLQCHNRPASSKVLVLHGRPQIVSRFQPASRLVNPILRVSRLAKQLRRVCHKAQVSPLQSVHLRVQANRHQ